MKTVKLISLLGATFGLAACEGYVGIDKSRDSGRDAHDLSQMTAGIWVDPNGCDHWIIDDGLEGYESARLTPDGRPVCSGVAQPNHIVGPYQSSGGIEDIL